MSKIGIVERVVDGILAQDLEPVLELVADDLVFTVLRPGRGPSSFEKTSGKYAMQEYFASLGGIVSFWKVRVFEGDQVLVLGRERYRTTCGIESETDFALVWDVSDGLVTHLLVVEDLTLVLGGGRAWTPLPKAAPRIPLRPTIYLPYRDPGSVRASA